jgi:alpha-L-fucosidase
MNDFSSQPPAAVAPDVSWFTAARLGLFAHWGVYSVFGRGEWVLNRERMSWEEYRAAAAHLTAARFSGERLAAAAELADARYLILTAKHHDGYCLWDTATTDWKCTQHGPGRDLLGETIEACHARGIRCGVFFSMADWSHPAYPSAYATDWPDAWRSEQDQQELVGYARRQISELADTYPIDLWWFDGAAPTPDAASWQADSIIAEIRQKNPQALINNRLFRPGDFAALERHLDIPEGMPWESDESLNTNWSWMPHDTAYHSLVRQWSRLLWCNIRGGNLLLNIAPSPDGDIQARELALLRQLGEHLHATRDIDLGHPLPDLPWTQFGEVSSREGALYLHVFHRDDEELVYCGINNRVRQARLIAPYNKELPVQQKNGRIQIGGLSGARRGPLGYIIELSIDGAPDALRSGNQDLNF